MQALLSGVDRKNGWQKGEREIDILNVGRAQTSEQESGWIRLSRYIAGQTTPRIGEFHPLRSAHNSKPPNMSKFVHRC